MPVILFNPLIFRNSKESFDQKVSRDFHRDNWSVLVNAKVESKEQRE